MVIVIIYKEETAEKKNIMISLMVIAVSLVNWNSEGTLIQKKILSLNGTNTLLQLSVITSSSSPS